MDEYLQELPDWLKDPNYSRYLSDNYVVLDFETKLNEDPTAYVKDNFIVCASWKLGPDHEDYDGHTHYRRAGEYDQKQLVSALEKADFWVAHNTKFEYGWLERCGLPLHASLAFCTQIGEYVIRANRKQFPLSLSACLKRRGFGGKDDMGSLLLKNGICPSLWPTDWLEKYSKQDTEKCEELFLHQRKTLIRTGMLATAFTRNILTPALVDIERNGLCLDEERVRIVQHAYNQQLEEILSEIHEFIGGANLSSPKQMREVLYEQLGFQKPTDSNWLGKNGDPTTKSEYILTLTPKNKRQAKFQELQAKYSSVGAALSKALNKFLECVETEEDNILMAELIQTKTETQRLASTGKKYKAQMQNIHRIFKALFTARNDGWLIGELDQAQLEYRVAVFMGQDIEGMKSIENHIDRHGVTATKMFGKKFTEGSDSVRSKLRTAAKPDTFKPLYGGMSGNRKQVEYYEAFKKEHYGITQKQEEWKMSALNTKKVKIPSGLIFYFPHTRMSNTGYISGTPSICNYPVQSFATADIVPIMVTYMWHIMRAAKLRSFLVNTVHDSIIIETHPEEVKIISDIGELSGTKLVYIYLKKVYNIDFNVPLAVDAKFASHWNDSEEWREQFLKKRKVNVK